MSHAEAETLMKSLGAKLKGIRSQNGWSQDDLAAKAGVSVPTVQRAERGERIAPDTIKALASAFGMSAKELLEEVPASERGSPVDYLPIREIKSGKMLVDMLAVSDDIDFDYGEVGDEATADMLGTFYDFCSKHTRRDVPDHPSQRIRLEFEAGRRLQALRARGLTVAGDSYTRTCYEVDDLPGSMPIVMASWDDVCAAIRVGTDGTVVDRANLDPARLPKYVTVTDSRVIRASTATSRSLANDEPPF